MWYTVKETIGLYTSCYRLIMHHVWKKFTVFIFSWYIMTVIISEKYQIAALYFHRVWPGCKVTCDLDLLWCKVCVNVLPGCKDQFTGARHERAGGGSEYAQVQRSSEQRGARGGDQTDGSLQISHQVYEEQGDTQTNQAHTWSTPWLPDLLFSHIISIWVTLGHKSHFIWKSKEDSC